jgi:hypothetical protein
VVRARLEVERVVPVADVEPFDDDVAALAVELEDLAVGEEVQLGQARVGLVRDGRGRVLVPALERAVVDPLVGLVPVHARADVVELAVLGVVLVVGGEGLLARIGHEAPAAVGRAQVAVDLLRAGIALHRAEDLLAGVDQLPGLVAGRAELGPRAVHDRVLAGEVADRDRRARAARDVDVDPALEESPAAQEQDVAGCSCAIACRSVFHGAEALVPALPSSPSGAT